MPKVSVGTFNVENLFMRYKLLDNERGSRIPKPVDPDKFIEEGGHINMLGFTLEDFGLISRTARKNTGKVILENDADVVGLQEVENMEALKQFNRKYLKKAFGEEVLIDANDPRLIDVALVSKLPIVHARSHQFDCLEVDIQVSAQKTLTLYVNHFKSKIGGGEDRREKQATRVAEIVQDRFGKNLKGGDFVVLGDLNSGPDAEELQPLLGLKGLENVIQRIADDTKRWTHFFAPKKETEQLDYILFSPTLTAKNPGGVPAIERRGLSDASLSVYPGPRFPGVGPDGTEASDHCGVFMTLNV